jgi:hypothetical protein
MSDLLYMQVYSPIRRSSPVFSALVNLIFLMWKKSALMNDLIRALFAYQLFTRKASRVVFLHLRCRGIHHT